MDDNRNMMLAIGLSVAILVLWQVFVGWPQLEKQREAQKLQQQQQQQQQQQLQQQAQSPAPQPGQSGPTLGGAPSTAGAEPGAATREQALAA